jgi:UPF0271 protein
MKILDTSGILRSDLDFSRDRYFITNSVLSELLDESARVAIDAALRSGKILLVEPKENFLKRVEKAAVKTGDISEISATDLDILAVALEKNLTIASDDYGIQNVASLMGLKFETTTHEGIKYRLRWFKTCEGCGKEYPMSNELCEICGSRLRKRAMRI